MAKMKMLFIKLTLLISGITFLCLPSYAGENHSPLLVIISGKVKLKKIIVAAETTDLQNYCANQRSQADKLLRKGLSLLVEYTEEGSGHYINQQAYATSLEQRAKTLSTYADFMYRIDQLNRQC